jgi:hypothetical protein
MTGSPEYMAIARLRTEALARIYLVEVPDEIADMSRMSSKPGRRRPDWHMRWPFTFAYAVVVAIFFAIDWRAGLLALALLPLHYLSRKLLAWIYGLQRGPFA